MAAKAKTLVKLKPITGRNEEKKAINSTKKIPPVQLNDQPQLKPITINISEFNRLVIGDFTQDFSKQASRLFRIFISSTFSDFKIERNELYRRVFPPIKQRCAQLGYEFQVVDMRWGVSDTADSDHTADIMCMDEIHRCIDLSVGINFIYLIGNRYGYMYCPVEIDEDEFETILEVAREENIDNIDLIQKWFQLDKNSYPSKYVYVPITTYFKHFEEQSIEQQEEKKQWQIEEKSLLKALRESVDKAFQKKKLSYQQTMNYFQSITEREIRRGTMEKNRSNVIGIVRDFSNPIIETAIDAKFFGYSTKTERITNSIDQLKTYCAKVTPAKQFKKFLVPWKSGGLNITNEPSHRQYIDEFCTFLTSTIMELIENTCRTMSNKTLSPFHEELLHHAIFSREKTKFFFGREELLANVHSRIELNRRNISTPIAFVAESGSGKTSFMARLAQELRVWYPTSVIFIRFLGTSAPSTNIESVIRSLCTQLKILYGNDDDNDDDDDDDDSSLTFSSLVRIFHERLKAISKRRLKNLIKRSRPKPLFILLDAIDQLEDTSKYSFQFDSWLLRYLPRDVHIFLSFIPTIERFNLKDLFLQFIRNDDSTLFTIPRLRPNDCEDIIRNSLQSYNRQLTSEQYIYLLATVEQNPKPLYLKLLIDIARRWTCYQKQSLQITLSLPETIEDAVEQLFARLENRHGKEFVQYSLAYLVYGLNGISENELEDCLSINDIVLNEIYSHHDPPIPNAIHVPSLLCQSFLYSIKEYISHKHIHNKHILSFYHRKFSESTRKRYKHLREQCHEHLIEIYCNDQTSYKRTIILKKRNNKILNDADRLINTQITNILNKRKLISLPYHCLEFGFEKDHLLRSICLFNLNFLSCQLKSLGHTIFLDTIRYCLRLRPNWFDLKRLYRAIWSIDDEFIKDSDVSLILAEQILGFIDDDQTSQLYDDSNQLNTNNDLEKLIHDCRKYCIEHQNSFCSLYAGFPQETGALAWSYSPVTHILYTNEFYTLVLLDGTQDEDETHFIQTSTVAVINLQTGKVDKIYLDENFNKIWDGYITKNGNKIYLFGTHTVQTFNSRTGDMLNEKTLSWDNKSFCNKAYCMTSNEEQLVVANEWRVLALDEVDEKAIYRSGRIPIKNPSFQIDNSKNVKVCLRCIGANDDYILCIIFDENNHGLITLWSLNEHVEMLPMRFAFIHHNESSPSLFDLPSNSNEILYLASVNGDIRILDLLKIKTKTKVLSLSSDDMIQQVTILQNQVLNRLVCLSDDIIAISTEEYITLFDRKNLSEILQTINLNAQVFNWNMINQDDHNQILITVDSSQQFITIYRQEKKTSSSLNQMKIEFRSNVQYIELIQTTTIMDNDEKKKTYILILLDDQTIQLLDTNQLSQSSLQPKGLLAKIKSYNISNTSITACEYDLNCPLSISFSNNQSSTPQLLHAFENMNIEYITMLNNEQYYVIITGEYMVYIYSIDNLNQIVFQYDLKIKSQSNLFSLQTYHSDIIIFMFMNQFIILQIKFYDIENVFKIQSEQIFPISIRDVQYSLEFTPNNHFLILKQSLNLSNYPDLNDFRIFTCNNQFKISPIQEPITYIKSKLSASGKIIGFMTYASSFTRSLLWLAYQGTILYVRLPSNLAELDIRSDYHCWMRHSLAMYEKTTEKCSLSINITSLAVQSPNDLCIASGGDDGSIVIWHLTNKYSHEVLESIHMDKITDLKFDMNTTRLFSSSYDRTLAIWSPIKLLHVLRVHIPIDRINLLSVSNTLLARAKFWGFDRLMMFYIGNYLQQSTSIKQNTIMKELQNMTDIQACDVASWAL
ncbi:unnamed protein product [Rotaria sp. Silwood1]|nr:unnamed protein product [Rotaria sp. Silwood1]CAF0765535.1 unnamed protein product [Rotaria sp. Silwood1]CAF3319944.1 unnamed protein product [Rotaria sp. Silwood1]CAF4583665.1 unnamed protein product [Rotaria sp. Silwood1]